MKEIPLKRKDNKHINNPIAVKAFNVFTDELVTSKSITGLANHLNFQHFQIRRILEKKSHHTHIDGWQFKKQSDTSSWLSIDDLQFLIEKENSKYIFTDVSEAGSDAGLYVFKYASTLKELKQKLNVSTKAVERGIRLGYIKPKFLIKKRDDERSWFTLYDTMIATPFKNSPRSIKLTPGARTKDASFLAKSIREVAEFCGSNHSTIRYQLEKGNGRTLINGWWLEVVNNDEVS